MKEFFLLHRIAKKYCDVCYTNPIMERYTDITRIDSDFMDNLLEKR